MTETVQQKLPVGAKLAIAVCFAIFCAPMLCYALMGSHGFDDPRVLVVMGLLWGAFLYSLAGEGIKVVLGAGFAALVLAALRAIS